jgi:hypothetical protein
METSEIRKSLHYSTYIEHSLSLKSAADENLMLFISLQKDPFTEANRIKGLGLYRSTLLLYSVSLELILKARALFFEIENIKAKKIKDYNDFLNKWKNESNGHLFARLLDSYSISLKPEEKLLIENLQPYTIWDGRYPFPLKEKQVVEFEEGKMNHGLLKEDLITEIDKFIKNQIKEMI